MYAEFKPESACMYACIYMCIMSRHVFMPDIITNFA